MNLVAYSTLIDAQANKAVLERLDSVCLPVLAKARAGKIDKAHALLREMREAGRVGDVHMN